MELKDLFLTPIYLLLIYGIAYWVRPKVTNKLTKKYYIPALTVKLIGAIALGLIYQFYYGGGDTYNYFNQCKIIYQAFGDSFQAGTKLLWANGEFDSETYKYTSRIYWYRAPSEYFIIKLAGFISLFCFSTYTVVALFFAFISFSGMWAMYLTFFKLYPFLHRQLAIAVFFLPSVFFWGSGLMKDSIALGALGWLFYGSYIAFIEKKKVLKYLVVIFISAYIIYTIKVYILLSFLPPVLFWTFLENNNKLKNALIKQLAKPAFILLGLVVAYFGATTLTEGDKQYDLDKIGQTSRINTIYLTKQAKTGSAYDIGIFDGSITSLANIAPKAVVVALYRPFLWEVRNPVMLLSGIEATIFIFLTLRIFFTTGFFKTIKLIASKPLITFCIFFSFLFAFGVGIGSGNFGTLVRYKIPFMPFYLSALFIMQEIAKREKLRKPLNLLKKA